MNNLIIACMCGKKLYYSEKALVLHGTICLLYITIYKNLCSQIPLPINTSVSDVTNFLQTHDLAITKQQESLLLKITESGISVVCI